MEKVHIFFENEYTEEKMVSLAEAMFAPYGGAAGLAAGRKRVLVKPNLVAKRSAESGAVTHPLMLRAVCALLVKAGLEVCVAESHGGPYTEATAKAQLNACGVTEALSGLPVKLYTAAESTVLHYPNGLAAKSFEVIKATTEVDLIINMCKLKTHTLATYSGAAKNTFGVVPGLRKFEMHARFTKIDDFARMLNDLHLSLPVALNIVDGIIGMEGNGPTAGVPRAYGFVAVCENAFLCDLVCADLLGLSSRLVPQLKDAAARGLCPESADFSLTNLSAEEYAAAKVTGLKLPDSTRAGAVSLIARLQSMGGGRVIKLFQPKPKVNRRQCVGCGKCAEYCPVKTIEMRHGLPKIKRDKCIRCFCCQELCPIGAMQIKANRILKI